MKKLLIVLAFAATACLPKPPPPGPTTVLQYPAIGTCTSVTDVAVVGDSPARQVGKRLRDALGNCYSVAVWAVDGSTPANMWKVGVNWPGQRIGQVLATSPDVVVFSFIGVLFTGTMESNLQLIQSGFAEMLARTTTARVVIAYPYHVKWVNCLGTDPKAVQVNEWGDRVRAGVLGAYTYADWWTAQGGVNGPLYHSGDCIHPNAQGELLLAQVTAAAIRTA